MRRVTVVLVLVLAVGVWSAVSSVAHGSTAGQTQPPGSLQADFNNDGADDLAVGVPFEDVGSIGDAGAVNVLYGATGGLTGSGSGSQIFTQDSPGVGDSAEVGDWFGFALAAGDFNNDGFADLAVGVPGEGVGSAPGAGAVNVLYGSTAGLTSAGSQLFTQVAGAIEAFDNFGWTLTTGDFDNDGFVDLAAGAPFEDVGSIGDAGAVSVIYGSAAGLTTTGGQLFTQVGSAPETDDHFGQAVAAGDFDNDGVADLAVGAPFEDVGSSRAEAGAVSVIYGSAAGLTTTGGQLFTQVAGAVEAADLFGAALAAGDFDNDGFADLAVGAPFEDVGTIDDAGAVSVIYGSAAGLTGAGGQLFTQVGSAPETDDLFGDALAAGDFDNDGVADLAVGAPFEDVGSSRPDAGAVSVLYGSAAGLTTTGGQLFTQVAGAVEAADLFGAALAAGDFDNDGVADLAVGAPFEDVGTIVNAGAVSVIYGSAAGLTGAGGQLFTQDSPGVAGNAEVDDVFGFALAAGDPGPSTASASPSASGSRTQRTAPSR